MADVTVTRDRIRSSNRLLRPLIRPGLKLDYHGIADWFLFGVFVLPSYFGIRMGFFDLTALRLFEILLLCCIFKNKKKKQQFIDLVKRCSHNIWIAAYMFVVVYTNIIHPSINTIFYWFTNCVIVFYCVTYLILYEYGINVFLDKLRQYTWILCVLSPMELLIGKTPFSLLDTLGKSIVASRFGSARIIGNCTTANGYAMYLVILLPLMCLDWNRKKIDLGKNKWLLILMIINIFFTGCRLTVGTGILCMFLCMIMQNKQQLKTILTVLLVAVPCLGFLLYLFRNVGFVQGALCTFFSAVDAVLNTNFAVKFGADAQLLYNSSYYRELLWKNTILGDWLNPWLGRGGSYSFAMYIEGYYIHSCDNYYVAQYITYAWPGLVTWLLMSGSFLFKSIKKWILKRDCLMWCVIVSIVCYFINLWYLDQLQTFPIMMTVFGLVYGASVGGCIKNDS